MTLFAEPTAESIEILTSPRADLSMLTGTWHNTNERTTGIVRVFAEANDGVLSLRFFGAVPKEPIESEPIDWGPVPATVFYDRNDDGMEQPFTARWELRCMTVIAQGFLRQGVLVILTFTRFHDGSARSSYFSKEFFTRM
jgi:hypothetical protein